MPVAAFFVAEVTIRPATTAADLAAVVALCWEYRDFLMNNSPVDRDLTETFYPTQKYQELMDDLERLHARPDGIILLAERDNAPVGCAMSYKFAPQTSEIKRVFVNSDARGLGVAERLCRALMDQAKADGFARVVLDTSRSLGAAQRLYARLGFKERGPYQPIPDDVLPHLVFYESDL